MSSIPDLALAVDSPRPADGARLGAGARRLHPFPARMAPEIVAAAINSLPQGSTVLDSMCGSGTVLRESVLRGHRAIGFDIDPLAVLISRVSTQRIDLDSFVASADTLAERAASTDGSSLHLPWIDADEETRTFTEYWFGPDQRRALRALSPLVLSVDGAIGDALQLALSKTIVTKEPRASLARDTSHSRPHRVSLSSNYDVIRGFRKAAADVARCLAADQLTGSARVARADARRLPRWLAGKADLVVISPPYGNAIDYLRGHRLALVWLGYTVPEMRSIRSQSVGRQAGTPQPTCPYVRELTFQLGQLADLPDSTQRRLALFVDDMYAVLQEIRRVLVPRGRAVLVIGNSVIGGAFLDNANMIAAASERVGLRQTARYTRKIPDNCRYLPPPHARRESALGKRMNEEVVLTFAKTP